MYYHSQPPGLKLIMVPNERIELSDQHWKCCMLPLHQFGVILAGRIGFEPIVSDLESNVLTINTNALLI